MLVNAGLIDNLLEPSNFKIILPFWSVVGFLVGTISDFIADYMSDLSNPNITSDYLGLHKTSLWLTLFIGIGVGSVATIANYYSHLVNHGLVFTGLEISGVIYSGLAFMIFYGACFIAGSIVREQLADWWHWLKYRSN